MENNENDEEQEAIESFIEEFGRAPDAQELHDWVNRNRVDSPHQPDDLS